MKRQMRLISRLQPCCAMKSKSLRIRRRNRNRRKLALMNNMSLEIKENVLLAPLTTFKIGGKAKYFVELRTDKELREALDWAHEKQVRFTILAGGSNVLVSDEGFDGLVIH